MPVSGAMRLAALSVAIVAAGCTTLPADVSKAVRRSLAAMDGGARSVSSPTRLAWRVSVSPSGDDWVIDYGKTGDFGWCGTGGCTRELWVARGDGHVLAFSEQVIGWRLTPGRPAQLDVDIHGANCDATGSESCLRRFVWNEALGRLDESRNREGSAYLVGPLFQPAGPGPYPEAVLEEIDRRHGVCQSAGGSVEGGTYPAVRSPDLNGDGIRDWIVGSKNIGCQSPTGSAVAMPALGVTVLISTGDLWSAALRVAESAYVVELMDPGPAQFGLRDERLCADGPGCPTRFFTWNGATQTLDDTGDVHWSPRLAPTAETWLECSVATQRAISPADPVGEGNGPEADARDLTVASHRHRMVEEFQQRYSGSSPGLSEADEAERRAVFEARYDDPEALQAARWRGDLCVTLL